MPTLKNAYTGDLILPDGTAVRRNGPVVPIADDTWAKMLKHPVVKAWVDEGRIVLVDAKAVEPVAIKPAPEPYNPLMDQAAEAQYLQKASEHRLERMKASEPVADEPDPRDPLREEARSLGIKVDMRWGEDRLREEIDKALAE